MASERREVRYPDQIKRDRYYIGRRRDGAQRMIVKDSIREQLSWYAEFGKVSFDPERKKKVFNMIGDRVLAAMMRTVELPDLQEDR